MTQNYEIVCEGQFPILRSAAGEYGVISGRVTQEQEINWYGSAQWHATEAEAVATARQKKAAYDAEMARVNAAEVAADGREIFEVIVFGGSGHDGLRDRAQRYKTIAAARLDRAFLEIDSAARYSPAIAIFRYHHGWKTFVEARSANAIGVRRNVRAGLPKI